MNNRSEVLIARSLHPEYRQVVGTYTRQVDINLHEIGISSQGKVDFEALRSQISENTSSIIVQYPNFFGIIEDLAVLAEAAHEQGAVLIVAIPEPVS
jgi:glycine dehydrogenase subunit 1